MGSVSAAKLSVRMILSLRSYAICKSGQDSADVAQLVEHVIGNDEVTGSIPVVGSRIEEVSILPIFSRAERSSAQ